MATKTGQGKRAQRLARAERVAQMRREQQRRERRARWLVWGSTATVVVVLAVAVGYGVARENQATDLRGVKTYKVSPNHVTTPVTYAQTPPAGGEHAPVWLNCNTYTRPVPNENAVHSLEHGAVWITYRPGLAKDQVAKLRGMLGQPYEILSPYPGLPAPVVASAWGKQLRLTGADDKRLPEFVRTYRQGPQAPEVGAACTGGIDGSPGSLGTPMQPGGGS